MQIVPLSTNLLLHDLHRYNCFQHIRYTSCPPLQYLRFLQYGDLIPSPTVNDLRYLIYRWSKGIPVSAKFIYKILYLLYGDVHEEQKEIDMC